MTASILIVDDDTELLRIISRHLAARGHHVVTDASGEGALHSIEAEAFDVVVTDLILPGVGGLDLLARTRVLNPRAAVILMTGHPALDNAIAALRGGACDYLEKPFTLGDLTERVERVLRYRDDGWRARALAPAVQPPAGGPRLIGESLAMRAVREQIARVGPSASNVLITGESGVGKELAARAVHAASARRERAFVALNCAAIPEPLLESQLFGHVRGAFTTAMQAYPGLFAAANEGTLLLDEIGELPLAVQAKLLRVIEDKQVWPVGGMRPVTMDVRIIASTNRELTREVRAGRFREDLFYRLDVLNIVLPPLRERPGDVPLLAAHLLERLNARLGANFLGIERDAMRALAGHPWKGNVRELENVLQRAMVVGRGSALISVEHLPKELSASDEARSHDLRDALRRFERQYLMDVLAETNRDKRRAADLLGISLASLYRKLNLSGDDHVAPA